MIKEHIPRLSSCGAVPSICLRLVICTEAPAAALLLIFWSLFTLFVKGVNQ